MGIVAATIFLAVILAIVIVGKSLYFILEDISVEIVLIRNALHEIVKRLEEDGWNRK